jgi:hypothetical protein
VTKIRIMKEIAENKLFKHIAAVSVCAQPVGPVKLTGQTGLHSTVRLKCMALCGSTCDNRSDRWPKPVRLVTTRNITTKLKLCTNPT